MWRNTLADKVGAYADPGRKEIGLAAGSSTERTDSVFLGGWAESVATMEIAFVPVWPGAMGLESPRQAAVSWSTVAVFAAAPSTFTPMGSTPSAVPWTRTGPVTARSSNSFSLLYRPEKTVPFLVCLRWMLIKSVAKAKVPFNDNRIHIPKADPEYLACTRHDHSCRCGQRSSPGLRFPPNCL